MPSYINESNQIRWDFRNPEYLQKFELGDSFYFKGEIYKLCYVSSLQVMTESGNGHFFVLTDDGQAHTIKATLQEVVDHYADKDILIKVKATGFENGFVIYTPAYTME